MSNVKFRASKKTTIILLIVLFFVIGGTGGYLLWRVNQQKTVAPTDSSAGGGGGTCCCPKSGCTGLPACTCGCPPESGLPSCTGPITRGSGENCNGLCCIWPYVAWYLTGDEPGCACAHRTTRDEPRTPAFECNDERPPESATPPNCPEGYVEIHRPGATMFEPDNYSSEDIPKSIVDKFYERNDETRPKCVRNGTAEFCYTQYYEEVRCHPCKNPYCVIRICKKAPPAPKCGDGKIDPGEECDGNTCSNGQQCGADCKCPETPPEPVVCDGAGKGWLDGLNPNNKSYQTCKEPVKYKLRIGSSQGIDLNSIEVKIGNISILPSNPEGHPTPTVTPGTGNKTAVVEGNLNTSAKCLGVGDKTLTIRWKAVGESTYSSQCSVSVNFKVTPPPAPEICDGVGKGSEIIFKNGRLVDGKYIYNNDQKVQYEYIMGDSKGINLQPGEHYPKLKIGDTNIIGSPNHAQPTFTPNTGSPKKVTISGELNTSNHRLSTGIKSMSIFWKRVGETGVYSAACQAKSSFTINACDAKGAGWQIIPPKIIRIKPAEGGQQQEVPNIPFKYTTADTDGVDNASITVLLDGEPIRVDKDTESNAKKVIVSRTPLPESKLSVGQHTLEIKWKDIYGAGNSAPCYAKTTFEIALRQVVDWDIKKVSNEVCIDDGTENPKAKITNTITVTNEGTGVGGLQNIVDTLDAKVVGSTVSEISHGGVYANGKITWRFETGSELANYAPGESKSFTYSYIVEKDKFGIYDNTAVATTAANNKLEAGASIEARCNVVSPSCGDGKVDTTLGEQCDPPGSACTDAYGNASVCTDLCACPGEAPIPQTGLFDESENIVVIGGILLFLGLGWTWLTKTYQIVNGKLVERSKERFEQRVVKK